MDPEAKGWRGPVEEGPRVGHCREWNVGRYEQREREYERLDRAARLSNEGTVT